MHFKKTSRRASLAAIAVLPLVLAACSGGDADSGASSAGDDTEAAAGGVTLTYGLPKHKMCRFRLQIISYLILILGYAKEKFGLKSKDLSCQFLKLLDLIQQ